MPLFGVIEDEATFRYHHTMGALAQVRDGDKPSKWNWWR